MSFIGYFVSFVSKSIEKSLYLRNVNGIRHFTRRKPSHFRRKSGEVDTEGKSIYEACSACD